MKKIIVLAVLICLAASSLLAAPLPQEKTHFTNTTPTLYRGVRPLGMGNAFLAMKGSDPYAIYYNPAAIWDYKNNITWSTGLLPFPPTEMSYSTIGLISDISNFKDDLDAAAGTSAKIDVFNDFINKHIGEFNETELRLPVIAAFSKYFYVGAIVEGESALSFRNRAFTNFELKSTVYGGLTLGSAYGLFDDLLELGVAVNVLYALQNERVITTGDILANNFDDYKLDNWSRGLGIGADVGVKFQIPDFGVDIIDTLKPTLAVTYQNIGNTKFRWMKHNGAPESIQQSVSAGIGISPLIGVMETNVLVDFREINVREDFLLKLNAGAEVKFPFVWGTPSFRVGANQGYPAFGAGIKLWKMTWNAAYYGRELGQYTRAKCGWRLANEFIWNF